MIGGGKTTYDGVDVTALSGARGFEHDGLVLMSLVFSARCAHKHPTSFVVGH